MKIGIIGPPSRICASTKIAFNQSTSLAKRGHEVKFILQKRCLDQVKSLYAELSEGVNMTEIAPVPLLSSFFDRLTRGYRTMFVGAHVPITQDVWYEKYPDRYIQRYEVNRRAPEVDIDSAAMLLRSLSISKSLAKWGCMALVCHATLMTIPALQLYAISKIRKIIYIHDIPISMTLVTEGRRPSSPLVKALAKFEKLVVNNSNAVASNRLAIKHWLRWYGIKLKYIPPGCTTSPDFPLHRSNYALTVTNWSPDKRPGFFLDIAERLRKSVLSLVMAGHWPDHSDLEEMRRRIKQRNLEEKLIVVPEPTEDELKRLYRHARCFVAPPKSGGHMMGALEAAAVGTPIIYPRVAGAWDMFTPDIHGFIANIEDIDNFAACITKFEDDALVYKMGSKIWLKAKELSWEAHALAIEKLLYE